MNIFHIQNSNYNPGYTLIELALVITLLAILAGFSFQAIMMGTDTYVTSTRDYLELFREADTALEKIVREIRETDPGSIAVTTDSIAFNKHNGHYTPEDSSLGITFRKSGSELKRDSGTLTGATLLQNVDSFACSKNSDRVVTIELTVSRNAGPVNLRTAVYPRQP